MRGATKVNDGTPGPWTVEKRPTKYPDLFTYNVLAPNGWTDNDGSPRLTSVAVELDSEADAQLIAAAPALLAAAEAALAALETITPPGIKDLAEAEGGVLYQLRHAVQQARGG